MMPTYDAAWVGAELARRFGPPQWSFTLTATDANRWAIRLARQVTGRSKILVNAYCYHGSVDESFAVARAGRASGVAAGERRPAGRSRAHDAGGRVQRRRGARARARARRRRRRADGAGADQHRHRAAGARLPGGGPPHHARARHAADQRRDAHVLRRPGRGDEARGAWSRTSSRSASRSPAGSRSAPTASRTSWRRRSQPTSGPTSRTSAASAARWPATRSRSPPRGPRSSTCSPTRRSSA